MNRRNLLRNQRGVTLLEVMFAIGILVLGTYLVVEGVNQVEESSKETLMLSTTERQINAIVDNIRTSLGSYQITYDTSKATKERLLAPEQLPMAWGPGVVMSVKDCQISKNCPVGRYGFVITPITGAYRGLYSVTLRMTNPEWKETYREYEFLATVQ